MKNSWLKALACGVLGLVAHTALAQGDPAAGKAAAAVCAGCHGAQGVSGMANTPSLAGQGEAYIVKQLQAFKAGERVNPIMQGQAAGLSVETMHDLAAYYASLPSQPAGSDETQIELGRKIYLGGIMDKGVPACAACHGPVGAGNPISGYPRIGGQRADYLIAQLNAYRQGTRNTDPGSMMRDVASKLSDEEIRAAASYAAGLYRGE